MVSLIWFSITSPMYQQLSLSSRMCSSLNVNPHKASLLNTLTSESLPLHFCLSSW